jgi:hypothetical protein
MKKQKIWMPVLGPPLGVMDEAQACHLLGKDNSQTHGLTGIQYWKVLFRYLKLKYHPFTRFTFSVHRWSFTGKIRKTIAQDYKASIKSVFLSLPAVNRLNFLEFVNAKNAVFSAVARLLIAPKRRVIILCCTINMNCS